MLRAAQPHSAVSHDCAGSGFQLLLWVRTYKFPAKAQRIFLRALREKFLFFAVFWFRFDRLVCCFLVAAFLFLRSGGLALLRSFRGLDFTRIVNQLDYRELGSVAVAMAQFQDARVTAR